MTRARLVLAGSALLTLVSIVRLPPLPQLLRRPATPFDRTLSRGAGPAFVLLTAAESRIPAGATVEVMSSDPAAEEYVRLVAIGLLPGRAIRRVGDADPTVRYRIVLGAESGDRALSRSTLLLRTAQGSVWARPR